MSFQAILLRNGPCHGVWVDPSRFSGYHAKIAVHVGLDPALSPLVHFTPIAAKPIVRIAVYWMTNGEDRTADFLGWDDEHLADEWPALGEALGNATDDEILKLMRDLRDEAERKHA